MKRNKTVQYLKTNKVSHRNQVDIFNIFLLNHLTHLQEFQQLVVVLDHFLFQVGFPE